MTMMAFAGMKSYAVDLVVAIVLSILCAVALTYLMTCAWQILTHANRRNWNTDAATKPRCALHGVQFLHRHAHCFHVLAFAPLAAIS